MAKKLDDQKKKDLNKDAPIKPDEETLNTTDPQDNMEGPISSLVKGVKEKVEENDEVSKEEADREKDRNM